MPQTPTDVRLIQEVGVIGYLLLVLVTGGFGLTAWLVKKLVDSILFNQRQLAKAVEEVSIQQAVQEEILHSIRSAVEEAERSSAAHLEIAREWKLEGVRRRDIE